MILLNIFAALALLLTISNLLFIKSLKPKQFSRSYFDKIDILIPMRNEESNVLPLLDSLRSAPGLITVLDDSSTDKTSLLLRASNIELNVITGQSLPEGWLGKPFACHQLAIQTNRKYIVFLDADVRLKAGAIESAIAYMEDRNWDFISPYPKQLSRGLFGFLIQPLLQWSWFASIPFFLTKFLPVRSMVVANGQFFIVKRNQYIMAGGHKAVRSEVIEDLELARALVSSGAKGGVVDGSRISSCLMYENNKELIAKLKDKDFNGMRKWVIQNLDKEPSALFTSIYDVLYENLEPKSIPQAVLIIAGYQYKAAFVADQEINMVACLTEIMAGCKFK